MTLQLPDEPPSLLHSISCLVEAVAVAAPQPAEQAADSVEQRQQPGAGASVGVAPQPADPPLPPGAAVLIRLTVYAAGEWLPAQLAAHRAAQRAGG
jgi:hypothetical protein